MKSRTLVANACMFSGNKIYNSELFKINSSTINKNVTATFAAGTSGTTTNSLKTGKITQK